jgi:hypothetical protein
MRVALVGLALVAVSPEVLRAQRTRLTISGLPLTVATTSANDFDAGAVALGSVSFTVEAISGPGFSPRETTVQVQCRPACPNTGTLALAGLQWRRNDLGVWNSLTGSYVTIEQRDLTYNGTNDPWSNSIHWRYVLSWTGNPPTPLTRWRIRFRLVVAAP